MLPVEGDAHGTQQQPAFLVCCGGGVDDDLDFGDHLGGVAGGKGVGSQLM